MKTYELYKNINTLGFRLYDPENLLWGQFFKANDYVHYELDFTTSIEICKRMSGRYRRNKYVKVFEGSLEECRVFALDLHESYLLIQELVK